MSYLAVAGRHHRRFHLLRDAKYWARDFMPRPVGKRNFVYGHRAPNRPIRVMVVPLNGRLPWVGRYQFGKGHVRWTRESL